MKRVAWNDFSRIASLSVLMGLALSPALDQSSQFDQTKVPLASMKYKTKVTKIIDVQLPQTFNTKNYSVIE